MEVSGIVVAMSEKISMEHCVGLLLMLYNANMEIHFYILVCDEMVEVWKNIHINRYCKFSNLKLGMLQTSSGGKIFLFKATETSTFSYMDGFQKCHVLENFKSLISVREIDRLATSSSPLGSALVSYQGSVTKLRNSKMGIYELDNKVLLCTAFNGGCMMPAVGSEVIVSNAHLIKDYIGAPILVCCGLSCVKSSKPDDINEKSHSVPNDPHFVNFCIQYGLNIFDVLWFERLLSRIKKKLTSLIAHEEILFEQDSVFLKNTLEYFLYFENGTTNKKLSLVEEFLSSPHQCLPFLKSRLPIGCYVPDLSEVLCEVIENAFWVHASPRWKFCVGSQVNQVIIGILYVSTNGNFYVADGTLKLPIIVAEDFDDCCHDQNILNELKNSNNASIVAIQEYDIIVEKISCKNGIEQSIQYIRTSFCRLYSLFSLFKLTPNDSFILQKFSCEPEKNMKNDENLSDFPSNPEEIIHRFVILSKIWTLQNKVPYCSCVLVLLLSENSQSVSDLSYESKSTLEDTFNFYDSRDDVEFANLIKKLDFLHIEDKECKIGYLSFEATSQSNVVFPGHIYYLHPKDNNKNFDLIFDEKDHRMFTWQFTPDMKIVHDPACRGNHSIEDYEGAECHGIKEIILKRQLNRNWFITCVLQDKTYEDEGKSRSTLCMVVKSEESSIKVYMPHFSGGLCGLLPGASLQLFGFLCFCSQSSSLYLKPSSLFGILIKQPKTITGKCRCEEISNSPKRGLVCRYRQTGSTFHCPLQGVCFVVKIISVEIFSACGECGRHERCTCCSQQKIRVQLCALIDDGKQLLLAHCLDETARKILNIDANVWKSLVSYTESSQQYLKFSDKVFWSKSAYVPFMNQVLNAYCSSKATSRKLMFDYVYVPTPHSSPADLPYVLCRSAEDVDYQKHVKKFYLKLMNNLSGKFH